MFAQEKQLNVNTFYRKTIIEFAQYHLVSFALLMRIKAKKYPQCAFVTKYCWWMDFVLLFYFTMQSVNQIQDRDIQMLSSSGKRNALCYIHETSRGAFLGQSDICDCIQRCQARVQYLTKLCHWWDVQPTGNGILTFATVNKAQWIVWQYFQC